MKEKEVIKVKAKQALKGFELKGTFLYEEKDVYYFKNGQSNLLSVNEQPLKDEIGFWRNFEEKYLKKLFWACGNSTNKPTILCFNDFLVQDDVMDKLLGLGEPNGYTSVTLDPDEKQEFEEELEKLDKEPCIFHFGKKLDFEQILTKLMQRRAELIEKDFMAFSRAKDIIVLVSEPQELDLALIQTMLAIGRSRKIYFVISIADKQKFIAAKSAADFDVISANCPSQIIWNGTEVEDIKF